MLKVHTPPDIAQTIEATALERMLGARSTTLSLIGRLAFASLLACAPAITFASQALAQQKNCMACHAAATRVVGPSYKEVAAKYATQDDAVNVLAERILKGSTGQWGYVPMPPNANVTPDEAKALTTWILQQK
jgi:cytochrome c